MDELDLLAQKLASARSPRDAFGTLAGDRDDKSAALRKAYHKLSRMCHPDRGNGDPRRADVFDQLTQLYAQAQKALEDGTYDHVLPSTTVRTKRHTYGLSDHVLSSDDIANTVRCSIDDSGAGAFKLATAPDTSDLLVAERELLQKLRLTDREGAEAFFSLLPEPVEGLSLAAQGDTLQATVFAIPPGTCTLANVHQAYPDGISPRDMAWIWRRLLDVLGYVHSRGIVHGAVWPTHVWLLPEDHHLVLADWHAAVDLKSNPGAHIPLMEQDFGAWYPPEVAAKEAPTPGTDILMSARTMVYLLGGDPIVGTMPTSVPRRLQGFLLSCLLTNPRQRPQDAWRLRDEFTELIEQLWGPRKFHPFHMPAR